MIRKVLGGPEDAYRYGPLCVELATWMVDEGIVPAKAAEGALERARQATDELPLAEELGSLLYEAAEGLQAEPTGERREWLDEMAVIERAEPGALWLVSESGERIGPVRVPERAAEIARPGWKISAAGLLEAADGWHLVELGNVYPR